MQIAVSASPRAFISALKSRLSHPLAELGQERFTGWCVGGFFSVSYHSGHELGRRYYPVFNKAVGFVQRRAQGSVVHCILFCGLTDPFSLLGVFLFSSLIFEAVHAEVPWLPGLLWMAAALPHGCAHFSARTDNAEPSSCTAFFYQNSKARRIFRPVPRSRRRLCFLCIK